jgi:hypothetical protein
MTTSAKQRQKQIEKRAKKRKLAKKKGLGGEGRLNRASAYVHLPMHECLVPSMLFEAGIGSLLASRKTATGEYATAIFLTDVHCLGVKDAFFRVVDQEDYEGTIKLGLHASQGEGTYNDVHPSCFKKLILEAVRYAGGLGFPPHKDYQRTVALLNGIDPTACPQRFDFGYNGKPFYVRGPSESLSQAKRIIAQLERSCGPDNFETLVALEPTD